MQYGVDVVNDRGFQVQIIGQRIIEALHIRFSQSRKAQLSKIRPDECIVHVLVVLKGVVLQAALQLAPKIEHLIDSYIPGFCFVKTLTLKS